MSLAGTTYFFKKVVCDISVFLIMCVQNSAPPNKMDSPSCCLLLESLSSSSGSLNKEEIKGWLWKSQVHLAFKVIWRVCLTCIFLC